MRHSRPFAVLTLLCLSLPAYAATFADVPTDHWAYPAVTELTTGHKLLTAMPDGRFQGDKPFTRYQFAQTLQALIEELEAQAKTTLAGRDTGGYQFEDIPATHPQRKALLDLANKYHLYEGVPDLDPAHFQGDKTVGRFEMAVVIDNLMRQAESRDVVRVTKAPKQELPFTDINATHWARPVIASVYGRYGVMVGFPDNTFRGREELTRYQFAAAATQTIPLIRELVKQTLQAKEQQKPVAATGVIDETPWEANVLVGVTPTMSLGLGLQGTQAIGNWFVGERVRLLPASPAGGFQGELDVKGGYTWILAPGWRLRPSIGLGTWLGGGGAAFNQLNLGYGAGLEWQALPTWSFGVDAEMRHGLFGGQGAALATFLPSGQLRAAYHPTPGLALQFGAAAWGVPGSTQLSLVAGPTVGMRWRF